MDAATRARCTYTDLSSLCVISQMRTGIGITLACHMVTPRQHRATSVPNWWAVEEPPQQTGLTPGPETKASVKLYRTTLVFKCEANKRSSLS